MIERRTVCGAIIFGLQVETLGRSDFDNLGELHGTASLRRKGVGGGKKREGRRERLVDATFEKRCQLHAIFRTF